MALLANQLLDPRVLGGVNGRMELGAPFLGAQNHPGLAPQVTEEDTRKNRKYPCPLCGKRFRFNSILSLHMRTHTGEKPFKCPYCEHRAAQKGNLKIHLRTHKQGILGKGRGRVREENRLLHELEERAILRDRQIRGGGPSSRLPRSPQPQPLPQTTELLANPPLPPPLAPSGAADARPSLSPSSPNKTPVPKEHTPQTPSSSSASGFRCSFCKGKFRKQQELERHIRILHKPYKCTLCDYAASQEDQLIGHVETTHIASESAAGSRPPPGGAGGRRPGGGEFPCEVCGQTFSQAWFLKGHMRKHKDSFEHCCQICGRRFKEPWFLKNHMKVHLNKLAAKSSEPPGGADAAVAVGNAAAPPDPRANLYSRYISDLHGRLLSGAGRAGQPDYQHILSAVAVEMKVKEMLGRMLAQGHAPPPEGESGGRPTRGQQALEDGEGRRMLALGQDPLLGLGGLLRPLSSSSGGVEYLQAAPGDRDTLSNGAGAGYPRWQILAPGLAHLEQVYTANDDQRHRYRSERRVRADERRTCDEERRARGNDPDTDLTDDAGATGLSHALSQGQAGTSSSHTGEPQEEPPPDASPAPGQNRQTERRAPSACLRVSMDGAAPETSPVQRCCISKKDKKDKVPSLP